MPTIAAFNRLLKLYYRAITNCGVPSINGCANILETEIYKFAALITSTPLTANQIHLCIFEHVIANFNYERHSVWHMLNRGFTYNPENCLNLAGLEPLIFSPTLSALDKVINVKRLDCESYCHYIADVEGEETATELYILLTLFGKNRNIPYMETFIRQKKRSALAVFLLDVAIKRGIYAPSPIFEQAAH